MLYSYNVEIIKVSDSGSPSSDLAVFMSVEVVKLKQHGHYKEELLLFNAKARKVYLYITYQQQGNWKCFTSSKKEQRKQ